MLNEVSGCITQKTGERTLMTKEEALTRFEAITGVSLKELDPEGQGSIRMYLPVNLKVEQFAAFLIVLRDLLEEEGITLERVKSEVGNILAANLMLHDKFPGQVDDLINDVIGLFAASLPPTAEREVTVTLLNSVGGGTAQ